MKNQVFEFIPVEMFQLYKVPKVPKEPTELINNEGDKRQIHEDCVMGDRNVFSIGGWLKYEDSYSIIYVDSVTQINQFKSKKIIHAGIMEKEKYEEIVTQIYYPMEHEVVTEERCIIHAIYNTIENRKGKMKILKNETSKKKRRKICNIIL